MLLLAGGGGTRHYAESSLLMRCDSYRQARLCSIAFSLVLWHLRNFLVEEILDDIRVKFVGRVLPLLFL